jgi:hypothetical protein
VILLDSISSILKKYDVELDTMQFLGYCVDLMNEVFPWMHIVQGRARKPSTQGLIEVCHKVFKAALVKWLDQKRSDNWIKGTQILQCEVNHYPMRSRSGLSPHIIYYRKPHIILPNLDLHSRRPKQNTVSN